MMPKMYDRPYIVGGVSLIRRAPDGTLHRYEGTVRQVRGSR